MCHETYVDEKNWCPLSCMVLGEICISVGVCVRACVCTLTYMYVSMCMCNYCSAGTVINRLNH